MCDDPRLQQHPLGFWQIADPPSRAELERYYRDKYFQQEHGNYRASYPADEHAYIQLKIAQRAHEVGRLRGEAVGTLLDVGCGEGFSVAFFEALGWRVEGLDHSIAGVEAMNPHLVDRVACGDLFALLDERIAQQARYDLIWLNNVLEHVRDPIALLTALRRIVSPGGVMVVTVPNDGSELQEQLLRDGDISARFWIAAPDHLSYFGADSLERALVQTGWTCARVLADFPIDLFLLHPGANYVRDGANGRAAHRARVRTELLLGRRGHEAVNEMYAAMARVGLGRQLTAFATAERGV